MLSKNNFADESRTIVQRLLRELTTSQLHQIMRGDVDEFIEVAFNIDPELTISLVKTYVETPEYSLQDRMDVLVCLARLKGKKEVDFIETILSSLSLEKEQLLSCSPQFATIFYFLDNRKLCQEYWNGAMDVFANNSEITGSEEFDSLLKALHVSSLEELRKSDPFEIIPLFEALKDNLQIAKAQQRKI